MQRCRKWEANHKEYLQCVGFLNVRIPPKISSYKTFFTLCIYSDYIFFIRICEWHTSLIFFTFNPLMRHLLGKADRLIVFVHAFRNRMIDYSGSLSCLVETVSEKKRQCFLSFYITIILHTVSNILKGEKKCLPNFEAKLINLFYFL